MNVQGSFMVDKRMSCLVFSKKHSSKTPEKLSAIKDPPQAWERRGAFQVFWKSVFY
jgi:hypothetical protein